MNYLKQINAFWNFRLLNVMKHSEITLYFAILHCANNSGWRKDVTIPNSTLINLSGFSDASQLSKIRNKLIQLQLIEYTKGSGNKAGTYRIQKLYHDDENNLLSPFDSKTDNQTAVNYTTDCTTNCTTYINKIKDKQNESYPPVIPRWGTDEDISAVIKLFNDICVSFNPVTTITQSRRRNILSRLKHFSIDDLQKVFIKAEQSDLLKGNITNWAADFDWIITDKNIGKIIDGVYDNKNRQSEIEQAFMENYE